MRYLKFFEEYNIDEDKVTKMKKLVDNEGNIQNREGLAIKGEGIFDLENNEYMAGISEDDTIYVNNPTDEGALNSEGVEYNIKDETKYDKNIYRFEPIKK